MGHEGQYATHGTWEHWDVGHGTLGHATRDKGGDMGHVGHEGQCDMGWGMHMGGGMRHMGGGSAHREL